MLRAVLTFVILMALFYGFIHTRDADSAWFRTHLQLVAQATGAVVGLFGYDVTIVDRFVHTSAFSVEIVRGCDAIEPAATFIAAVIASPASFWLKIPGIIVGSLAMMVINIIRVSSLFFVGVHAPASFDMIHEQIWQPVFIVLAVAFWAVWMHWATRRERRRVDVRN